MTRFKIPMELVALVAAVSPVANTGRPPFAHETMLRIHLFAAVVRPVGPDHERGSVRGFAVPPGFRQILGRRAHPRSGEHPALHHLFQEHQFSSQILATVNATLIAAPSSTKSSSVERNPQMHQTNKGNQWHFGMEAHIGVDADSDLVHTVVGTAANINDVTQAIETFWHVAMRPGKRRELDKSAPMGRVLDELEHVKARIRAKVEHPFRVVKRQFWHVRVRYRELAKNTAQLHTLFAFPYLWMARHRLLQRPQG